MNTSSSGFWKRPYSRLGWWAFALAAANILMNVINPLLRMLLADVGDATRVVMPNSGILMLLFGLTGGVLGVLAIVLRKERSWAVWLAVLIGIGMLTLLIGELVIPH